MSSFVFPDAVRAVESWLNGAGKDFAAQVPRAGTPRALEWILDLRELGYSVDSVRVVIGKLFPAAPCELFVAPELCLRIPHVEENGRVCLSDISQLEDFERPVAAVARAINRFKTELLELCANEQWRETELHKERLSYWSRYCDVRQKSPRGRPRPRRTFISAEPIDAWAEGKVAAYIPKGSRERRIHTQVVSLGDVDPVELASRHGFDGGTIVRGSALFVHLPVDFPWTPATWPRTFLDLNVLVESATGGERSVVAWLGSIGWRADMPDVTQKQDNGKLSSIIKPLLVVLCHGQELYGFQISQSSVSLVTTPHAAPIKLLRIDPAWSLTRDHGTGAFNQRQHKAVLVLGAGSLGSPLIDILARSGIAKLDIVDLELFEPANVARHSLGMSSVLQSKARALAARLNKDIPGVRANGFVADARSWCAEKCRPGQYDLVVDLTADLSVRTFLAITRNQFFGNTTVVHAWVEPFCAAFHVVATDTRLPWPPDDPASLKVNVADYSSAISRVKLPACSDGFHPYGSADITQAAGFAAERILEVVDSGLSESTVWSFVRSQAFFDKLGASIATREIVPSDGGPRDGIVLTRPLADVLEN